MAKKVQVYDARDGSRHSTRDEARAHESKLILAALAYLRVEDILADIEGSEAVREAIIHANNLVQAWRQENGRVKRRKRLGQA